MTDLDPAQIVTAGGVSRLARAIYGAPLGAMRGVLHVVAVAEEDGARRVMRIGPHAPKSAMDHFVLDLARARVDAILVTGAILRAEPTLRYDLAGPGRSERAFEAWRRDVAGLSEPPWLLVLTGGDVRFDHPAFSSWARPIVYTRASVAARLRAPCEVIGVDAPSARGAIDYLLRERGCASVSVEAGPSTAVPLYDPPVAIDELMLSVFEEKLDPRARGGRFPSEADLASAGLTRTHEPHHHREPSGPWRFERWTRG